MPIKSMSKIYFKIFCYNNMVTPDSLYKLHFNVINNEVHKSDKFHKS